MNKIKFFWLSILNIQLLIGFFTSYSFLHRHIIIDNVLLFIFCIFISSNILFLLMSRIKLQSLKIFFSITVSSFLFMLLFMKKNNLSWEVIFSYDAFLMIAASIFYTVTLLKLYITTPLLVIYEVFFYKKG